MCENFYYQKLSEILCMHEEAYEQQSELLS